MNNDAVKTADAFLTIRTYDGSRKLLHLGPLVSIHGIQPVVQLLGDILREHERTLRKQIKADKTSERVDKAISRVFRIKMAINTLRNAHRAKEAA